MSVATPPPPLPRARGGQAMWMPDNGHFGILMYSRTCRAWKACGQSERLRPPRHPTRTLLCVGSACHDVPGNEASRAMLGSQHTQESPHPASYQWLQWLGYQVCGMQRARACGGMLAPVYPAGSHRGKLAGFVVLWLQHATLFCVTISLGMMRIEHCSRCTAD